MFEYFWKGVHPEFLRAFQSHTLAFQRALLNFQGLRARGPFLFKTLLPCDSPRDDLYACVIQVHEGKATYA